MKAQALITAIALAVPLLADAQTASTLRIDQRQVSQENRIQQGVQSGALTQKEAANLEQGQQHVQRVENKAMADGTVTKKEASRVAHVQDQQSRKISHQKHDRQHDYNHDGKKDRPKNSQ